MTPLLDMNLETNLLQGERWFLGAWEFRRRWRGKSL